MPSAMTYRFDCLGPETFGGSNWVTIQLYNNHRLRMPVSVPSNIYQVRHMCDAELFMFWMLTRLVCAWRGASINGWPKWAIATSSGRSAVPPSLLFTEIAERIADKYQRDVARWTLVPKCNGDIDVYPLGQSPVCVHSYREYINDTCELAEEPWLK